MRGGAGAARSHRQRTAARRPRVGCGGGGRRARPRSPRRRRRDRRRRRRATATARRPSATARAASALERDRRVRAAGLRDPAARATTTTSTWSSSAAGSSGRRRRRRAEPFLDITDLVTLRRRAGAALGRLRTRLREVRACFYVDYTDTDGRHAHRRVPALGRRPRRRRSRQRPRAAADRRLRLRTTTAACCCSGPTASSTSGTGDGGGGGDPERNAQDLDSPLGQAAAHRPRARAGELRRVARARACATRGASRSTGERRPLDRRRRPGRARGDRRASRATSSAARRANFGWSAFEGTEPLQRRPAGAGRDRAGARLRRATAACSVTGGYVVRDPELRSLYGRYLYGDFCDGRAAQLHRRAGGGAPTTTARSGSRSPQLSSFGEDARGHIYAVSLDGPVYRLVAGRLTDARRALGRRIALAALAVAVRSRARAAARAGGAADRRGGGARAAADRRLRPAGLRRPGARGAATALRGRAGGHGSSVLRRGGKLGAAVPRHPNRVRFGPTSASEEAGLLSVAFDPGTRTTAASTSSTPAQGRQLRRRVPARGAQGRGAARESRRTVIEIRHP